MARPINVLKLMLEIEQPQAKRAGNHDNGKLNQQIGPQTDSEACPTATSRIARLVKTTLLRSVA